MITVSVKETLRMNSLNLAIDPNEAYKIVDPLSRHRGD